MQKLIECVPNFSVGRDQKVIEAIANSIKEVQGVHLLNIDIGYTANRTVMTFAGDPQAVCEAAYKAIKIATQLIDMSVHEGAHPRMGAIDVCPLIPIHGISFEECKNLSVALAERVANNFDIPIILYEMSASAPHRRNLSHIRAGEYEGWVKKIKDPSWWPDFGPKSLNVRSGVTAIGCRDFLIAYNVNLDTKDLAIAKKIAARVRESGYTEVQNDIKIRVPGRLKYVKAIAWYIQDFDKIQISMNLTNFREVGLYEAFTSVVQVCNDYDIRVSGSELIGLIPKKALIDAYSIYVKISQTKENMDDEIDQITYVSNLLNLNDVKEFNPKDHILEEVLLKYLG
jgi:glutamate formiminotransferase / formiminotetrahydrofolate cyclodeaminase